MAIASLPEPSGSIAPRCAVVHGAMPLTATQCHAGGVRFSPSILRERADW